LFEESSDHRKGIMPHLVGKSEIKWHFDIEGTGEALLFIHGWGVDKRIWRQQSKYFSQSFKVVSIDLPGHGKSSWLKVTLEDMVHDIKYLLDTNSIKEVSLLGSSLGGLLALKFYQVYPNTIKRMVLVGSMPKFSKSDDYPHGLDIERMKKLSMQLDTDYPSIINVFFRSLFTKQERQTRRFKWLQKFRRNIEFPMKDALHQYLDIMEKEDLRHVLKNIKVPIQFINGSEDEICTMKTIEVIKNLTPDSRFDIFEQCGHFPFLSKPHEFNELVEDFLKKTTL